MVVKWRIVWFQTEKEKSTKTLYENEIRKKDTGDFLDRLLVFADPVIWLSAAVLTAVLFEGKSGEKNAEQDEE